MDKKHSTSPEKYLDEVVSCSNTLKTGGILLLPSETGWGAGCDATNNNTVNKLLKMNLSSQRHNLTVLVDHADRLGRYVKQIPEAAIQLIEVNDKPMTIIYPGVVNLPAEITAQDESAGIRITTDSFCKKLIGTLNRPLAFIQLDNQNFKDISEKIKSEVDYVVKWRQSDSSHPVAASVIKVGLKGEIEIIKH